MVALVVAKQSAVKARLQSKARLRPHALVRKKMPDGTGQLSELPDRARLAQQVGEDAADDAYCKAIATVTKTFGMNNRGQSTADEHAMYARLLDGWLVRQGFGSYVVLQRGWGGCPHKRQIHKQNPAPQIELASCHVSVL